MATANIKINGVASSDDDLPIDTVVNLDNAGTGGELTYAWLIVSQPEGAADALSATNIVNPTFTPKKEGSYLLQLTVNGSLVDRKIVGIRDLKTYQRSPAPIEQTEVDGSGEGWSKANNRWQTLLSGLFNTKHGLIFGYAAENLTQGDPVTIAGTTVIKAGLPGEETIVTFRKVSAIDKVAIVGIIEMQPDGTAAAPDGSLVWARFFGPCSFTITSALAVGDPVFVSQSSNFVDVADNDPGARLFGVVIEAGGGNIRIFVTPSMLDTAGRPWAQYMPKQLLGTWHKDNFPANQLLQPFALWYAGSTFTGKYVNDGFYITDIEVSLNAAAAGAAITIDVILNGVADPECRIVLNPGDTVGRVRFGPNYKGISDADTVLVQFTTPVGWTGTTVDGYVEIRGIPAFVP